MADPISVLYGLGAAANLVSAAYTQHEMNKRHKIDRTDNAERSSASIKMNEANIASGRVNLAASQAHDRRIIGRQELLARAPLKPLPEWFGADAGQVHLFMNTIHTCIGSPEPSVPDYARLLEKETERWFSCNMSAYAEGLQGRLRFHNGAWARQHPDHAWDGEAAALAVDAYLAESASPNKIPFLIIENVWSSQDLHIGVGRSVLLTERPIYSDVITVPHEVFSGRTSREQQAKSAALLNIFITSIYMDCYRLLKDGAPAELLNLHESLIPKVSDALLPYVNRILLDAVDVNAALGESLLRSGMSEKGRIALQTALNAIERIDGNVAQRMTGSPPSPTSAQLRRRIEEAMQQKTDSLPVPKLAAPQAGVRNLIEKPVNTSTFDI